MERTIGEITTRVASGDAEALAGFYAARFDWIYAEARRMTGRDESFCLDVVQDVMLRVIRSLRTIESEEALRAWLRRAVRSCAVDRLRRDARRQRRDEAAATPTARAATADARERLAWLERELEVLDEPTRAIVLMRHRFGWTLERIGAMFGLSAGAVDGRLRRAIRALRRRREEVADEP